MRLILTLINNIFLVVALSYILTRQPFYEKIKHHLLLWHHKLLLMVLFGIASIYGTYSGIHVLDAYANIRDLGPVIGGLLGGPLVGIGAALIGGAHRLSLGGGTAIPGSIATALGGLIGGLIFLYREGKPMTLISATLFMFFFEIFHMALILLISHPFSYAWSVVRLVSVPMILGNTAGMIGFNLIMQDYEKQMQFAREKRSLEGELHVARQIQDYILPNPKQSLQELSEFKIDVIFEPCKEIGGDFYDFFLVDANHLCINIGDVMGKSIPAAIFMALTKTLLKSETKRHLSVNKVLTLVNNELLEQDRNFIMFSTLLMGLLNFRTGRFIYSNAGHCIPYLLSDGKFEKLPNIGGLPIGIKKDVPYDVNAIDLTPGSAILLYTDGLSFMHDMNEEDSSYQWLEEKLKSIQNVNDMIEQMRIEIKDMKDVGFLRDDVTILMLQYNGPSQYKYIQV